MRSTGARGRNQFQMTESNKKAQQGPRPTVSVVLPTFNRLDYLRATIASVFAQTFSDWELIIADDGSDAATRDYLRSLEDPPHVRVVWGSHCGVPAVVRNDALTHARGDYVAFIDSDDLWAPHKVSRQVEALRGTPQHRWCYSDYIIIDAQGSVRPASEQRLPTPEGWILEPLLASAVDIWTPAVMVQRELLMQLGGFNPQLVVFEDYDLWMRLAVHSGIVMVHEPLIAVRRHEWHLDGAACGASMAASRVQSLQSVRKLVSDARMREKVDRAIVHSTVQLACGLAATDRRGAARCMFTFRDGAWRYGAWWSGLPRVLLKLLVPRPILAGYRRCRGVMSAWLTARAPHA